MSGLSARGLSAHARSASVPQLPLLLQRGSISKWSVALGVLLLASGPSVAHADGQKRTAALAEPAPAAAKTSDPSEPTSHRKGPRPKVPDANLPDDVPLPVPSERARHAIAEGATAEEQRAGASDEELAALEQAERVLFPAPVRGIVSGWSFDLPEASAEEEHGLGLPYVAPALEEAAQIAPEDLKWLRSLTMPDLPVRLDQHVVTYLKFYRDSQRGRTIAAIWTRKSGRYVAEMKAQLRRAGLPTDLVWLSMIESGHNPTITSPAGAVGLWQFMPESARMYGLVVDRWVDERRDPARATQAAIRFLSDLHQRFGNWELAMGAYNMGYAGMSRAISKYSSNDYWALSRMESGIPWETTLYVPKIFALAIVMNNRQAFGVGGQPLDPPVAFDTILVEPATPLKDIAQAAGLAVSELEADNPQYIASRLPPFAREGQSKWSVRVPVGKGEGAVAALAKKAGKSVKTHRVRLGETLETIAADFQVSESALDKENDLTRGERIEPGSIVVLPASAQFKNTTTKADVVVGRNVLVAGDQRRVFYQVVEEDSLSQIAAALGVSEADLARWNLLNQRAHLRSGMTLQVLVDKNASLGDVRLIEEANANILVAGTAEFHEYVEGQKGKRRIEVEVQSGDTLAKIGARYGMSVGSMERVNRRSRSTKLVAGERLIVYTDRTDTAAQAESAPAPLPALVAPAGAGPGKSPTASDKRSAD